jgi:CxxC motif-containing protein (DUF1111 family)
MNSLRALLLTLAFVAALLLAVGRLAESVPTEAPAGFDDLTNGLVSQATHDADRALFELARTAAGGLGPPYNRASCADCHVTPVSGGSGTATTLLAGTDFSGAFVERLIRDNAICPAAQDPLPTPSEITSHRLTLNLLGDGFVEAVSDATFAQIQAAQPAGMRGTLITVPALEGGSGVGRFGWKSRHVSLLSFAADEMVNQIGVTNPLLPNEVTTVCDTVADPEDVTSDTDALARFIRATKVPPRDTALAGTATAIAGANLFAKIGCGVCHVASLTTAPAGTVLRGSYVVSAALGDKIIHPYSDFLLHDIGTGDGFGSTATSQLEMRTAPLWGLRTRPTLLHDGSALTLMDAIQRHGGEAAAVTGTFNALSVTQKRQVLTFLLSL